MYIHINTYTYAYQTCKHMQYVTSHSLPPLATKARPSCHLTSLPEFTLFGFRWSKFRRSTTQIGKLVARTWYACHGGSPAKVTNNNDKIWELDLNEQLPEVIVRSPDESICVWSITWKLRRSTTPGPMDTLRLQKWWTHTCIIHAYSFYLHLSLLFL